MHAITLNELAVALLGAGATIYHCTSRGGYWKAAALVCGFRVERDSPDPYAALAAVASVLQEREAAQHASDLSATPEVRAAYRAAWAASAGQPVPARFAAAEAAATEPADWPSPIRTAQDNARTMQRLRAIAGRPSAAPAATVPLRDTDPHDPEGYDAGPYGEGWEEEDESGRDYAEELAGDYYSQAD